MCGQSWVIQAKPPLPMMLWMVRFTGVHEAVPAMAGPTIDSVTSNTFHGRSPRAAPRPTVHLTKSRRAWSGMSMYLRRIFISSLARVGSSQNRSHRDDLADLRRGTFSQGDVAQVDLVLRGRHSLQARDARPGALAL